MQKRWRVWQQLIPRSARERKVKKYKVADVTALCMTRSRKVLGGRVARVSVARTSIANTAHPSSRTLIAVQDACISRTCVRACTARAGRSRDRVYVGLVIARVVVLIAMLAACGSARAQCVVPPDAATLPASNAQIERMQLALSALSDSGDAAKTWSAAISVISGGALLGYGTWIAVDGDSLPQNGHRTALSATMLMLGGLVFASGLRTTIGITTTDQERFARWQRERALAVPDQLAIARYEGELRAEAAIARQIRMLNGVAFIGTAAAGLGVFALAITAQFQGDARTAAWFWGTALLGTGTWQGISNLTSESKSERVWNAYHGGVEDPGKALASIRVSPAIERRGLGLRVAARF